MYIGTKMLLRSATLVILNVPKIEYFIELFLANTRDGNGTYWLTFFCEKMHFLRLTR